MTPEEAKEYAKERKNELRTMNPDAADVAILNKIIEELRENFKSLVLTDCGKYVILYLSDGGTPVLSLRWWYSGTG